MILENPEQEKQRANGLISEQLQNRQEYLANILAQIKETKKAIRKLNKQTVCEHDFKLKVNLIGADQYKCKKCKFEFANYPNE